MDEKEEEFHRINRNLIPIQPSEYKGNSLWHLINTVNERDISEELIERIKQKISKNEGYVNLDTNNNLLNYFAQWYFYINQTDQEHRDNVQRLSTKLISTIFELMTPRQRTNILISFFRRLIPNVELLPSQRHVLSLLFEYEFITTSEKLIKISDNIFKRNPDKNRVCQDIISTTTKRKNIGRVEPSVEICFNGIADIASIVSGYLDDTVVPVIEPEEGEIEMGEMRFKRSKKASKARSKKASKARSKKASKARSKKASKARSKKASKARSKKASKARSKKASKARSKKASKARSKKESKARSKKASKARNC